MKLSEINKCPNLIYWKYKNWLHSSWFLILLLWFVSGCQQSLIHQERLMINKHNVEDLVEITKFQTGHNKPIAAMIISPGSQNLLLSNAGVNGTLQKWHLSDQMLLEEIAVGPVSVTGTAFGQTGQLLALTAGETGLTNEIDYSTELSGVIVIDTETGLIDTEVGFGYGGSRQAEGDIFSSVALSSDGRLLIAGDEAGVIFWNREEEKSIMGTAQGQRASAVTFSKNDSRAAIAFEDGMIDLYDLSSQLDTKSDGEIRMPINLHLPAEIPLAVTFSPDNQWLIRLGHQTLAIFDVEVIDRVARQSEVIRRENTDEASPQQIGEALLALREEIRQNLFLKPVPSGPAGALAFNPVGDLLAVGTVAGWQIWDVEQQELLMEKAAEGVYALTFSPDGRWFAWGDAEGTVHLWAIESK